ncbi:hypothetical protein C0991_012272 [Blastosporella zonata]|nr:hypothetical protein C0991_012272 [Blastosporella zonata]
MSTKQTLPALLPFKEHGASLARALKRDIQRALLNTGLRQPPSFYDSYSSNTPMTDHDLQHTVDLSNLSHHSLRVLSDIFALRALHVLIPVQDLNDLLKEILKIASMIELPTPNSEKTVSLVFWLLQIQRLPSAILEPRKDEIVKALRDALNGQRGLQAKRDSLKAINSLLKHQPVLFTTPLHGFIFTILANLTSEDTDCRLQACNALSGLVLAKFDRPDFPHQGISQEVHSFLKPQIPPRNHQPSFSQEDYPLHYFVAQALAPESNDTQEPIWAVITLASLITLADRWLYTYKDLAFCADRLQPAFVHKRREVRQLARAAWGCLVWAFTLLPAHPTWLHPEDPSIADVSLSVRGKAFRFLKSDVTGGKGVLLARGLLLSPARGNDRASADAANVSRALLVLKTMIIGGKPSDSDVGIRMLCGVLSMRGTKTDDVKPNLGLFEGTIIDGAPRKARDTVKWVSEMNLERIRALAEAEIIHHWETLVDVWIDAVERTLQMSLPLSNGLLDVWQSLLLARADLTHARLTGSSRFAIQIAGIVTGFLVQSLEPPMQVLRLVSVKRLWGVMKNVFAVTWLPAEMVLASVLKVNFSLNDMEVKGAWSELCADLILVGVPTLLHVISTGSEGKDVTRHLWTVLAKTWQVPDGKAHWEELVSFLVIPFKSWVMSGVETELWKAVLHSSVSMAEANSVTPNAVVDRFFLRLEEEVNAYSWLFLKASPLS